MVQMCVYNETWKAISQEKQTTNKLDIQHPENIKYKQDEGIVDAGDSLLTNSYLHS